MGEDLDRSTRGQGAERRGFSDNYVRGLHASARGNAAAYGYSVTIGAGVPAPRNCGGVPLGGSPDRP